MREPEPTTEELIANFIKQKERFIEEFGEENEPATNED
jgi:hypothetical protein